MRTNRLHPARQSVSVYCPILLTLLLFAVISGCAKRTAPAPVIDLYQGRDFRDFEKQGYQGKQYTVRKGDTLFSIAWFSGNDYKDIARINQIGAPYDIYPGQTLQLEKDKRTIVAPAGQTSKNKPRKAVDPPEKQAYGKSNPDVKDVNNRSQNVEFPQRISRWVWPAKGKLTSTISVSGQSAKGIEIHAKRGTDVVAAAAGKVVYTGNALRGYGQLIIIKHSESFLSAYAHNDSVLVKEQQWITAGQKIASMGSTGTDNVKLRFEVRYRGKSVDPLTYLPSK